MTLKEVREFDFSGHNINQLVKAEEERTDRKPRSTVVRELRAEKRRRQVKKGAINA